VQHNSRFFTLGVWGFYLVVVLEFLFMISPLGLHFYASYGPVLNVLRGSPWTSWLTGFFLPHFSHTTSPILNSLRRVGFGLAFAGLLLFVASALQVYTAKLLRRGEVTSGLYRFVRHPQYLGLVVLGFGTLLIWSRFLVLLSYLTMVYLYSLLARREEAICLKQFGERYRVYQESTGMFFPRLGGFGNGKSADKAAVASGARLFGVYVLALVIATGLSFALRRYSLHSLCARYEPGKAIVSPAVITAGELTSAYRLACSDPELQSRLTNLSATADLIVYVVPRNWYLPDLPLPTLEEIRRTGGGHRTGEFDHKHFKVLFTRARIHSLESAMAIMEIFHRARPHVHSPESGIEIMERSYGLDPVLIVDVDLGEHRVLGHRNPPEHVIWGDIPTPLF
jgi:protein-S-isoprenylcysteine O-methyltransferase Ste14